MQEIDRYLEEILCVQLKKVNMPYRFIKRIQDDIKYRMLSCLAYWHEPETRKAILFLSLEEALFYEPENVQENIREFVVTTIRNSMLEIAASDDCRIFKIPEPLSNAQIKQITMEAIRYFNKYDMDDLANRADIIEKEQNVYTQAMIKYPLAWDVLHKLANFDGRELKIDERYKFENNESFVSNNDVRIETTVCNGFTLEFDEALKEAIGEVLADKVDCFYSDCFKMISRNFEKVLHILQILLEREKVVCTCNYYISSHYLEKRKRILRAAHDSKDAMKNLNFNGAPDMLEKCIKSMKGEL